MALYLKDGNILKVTGGLAHNSNCCCSACTYGEYCCVQGITVFVPCDACALLGGTVISEGEDCTTPCSETIGNCCNIPGSDNPDYVSLGTMSGCDCITMGGVPVPIGQSCTDPDGDGWCFDGQCCFGPYQVAMDSCECAEKGGTVLTGTDCPTQEGNYGAGDCCVVKRYIDETYYNYCNNNGVPGTWQRMYIVKDVVTCTATPGQCNIALEENASYTTVEEYDGSDRVIRIGSYLQYPEKVCNSCPSGVDCRVEVWYDNAISQGCGSNVPFTYTYVFTCYGTDFPVGSCSC